MRRTPGDSGKVSHLPDDIHLRATLYRAELGSLVLTRPKAVLMLTRSECIHGLKRGRDEGASIRRIARGLSPMLSDVRERGPAPSHAAPSAGTSCEGGGVAEASGSA